jgi:hypothetical protein
MSEKLTTGQTLLAFKERTGWSLKEIADAAEYADKSSVQKYFHPEYDLPIGKKALDRFVKAFVGKGSPKVRKDEVMALSGLDLSGPEDVFEPSREIANRGALNRGTPMYGTALGAPGEYTSAAGKKVAIEQATLDQSEVVGHLRTPSALEGRKKVYGVYVAGVSMEPRFREGEAVFVDPLRPARIGDDVVVQLCVEDETDMTAGDRVTAILIKRLVRRTDAFWELEQYNPPRVFRVEAQLVKRVHRIVPSGELYS